MSAAIGAVVPGGGKVNSRPASESTATRTLSPRRRPHLSSRNAPRRGIRNGDCLVEVSEGNDYSVDRGFHDVLLSRKRGSHLLMQPTRTTLAPSVESLLAMASPPPRVAPVTKATRPSNRRITAPSLHAAQQQKFLAATVYLIGSRYQK